MSTRGVFGFQLNGKRKITYNQYDSYPTELGTNVLNFLHKYTEGTIYRDAGLDKLREAVNELKLVSHWEGIPSNLKKIYNRDISLEEQLEHGYMIDNQRFLNDSMYCEWGYIINLDAKVLEVYYMGPTIVAVYKLNNLPKEFDQDSDGNILPPGE